MTNFFHFNLKLIFTTILFVLVLCGNSYSQNPRTMVARDCAVMVTAKSQKSPPAIILKWKKNDIVKSYDIRRKGKDEQSWSAPIATLDSNALSYTDYNVKPGNAYEYMITATEYATVTLDLGLGGNPTYPTTVFGYGYVYAGIDYEPPQIQGRVILLVDETIKTPLANEIETLKSDLVSEGWAVSERTVPRTEKFSDTAVIHVKDIVVEEFKKDRDNTNTVFILGRVAVPYSGDVNKKSGNGVTAATDAHPDHCGAWPADVYYGHLFETDWSDYLVTDTLGSRKVNWNIPGDGKFDVTQLMTDVALQVGRVDFYNMPAFAKSETELLRSYLKRDHEYRTGQIQVTLRGLVDDNFGWLGGENPGQNAYRNFPPMVGNDSVNALDWFTELPKSSYLWAYGCGGGSFNSCGGIGYTSDFAKNQMNVVFSMLFGSYFGDWDSQDNILRAILCSDPPGLTSCWAARPSWFFHHMGLGVPIGFSNKISQNNYPKGNTVLYMANQYTIQQDPYKGYVFSNQAARGFIHMALMGDPTLTMNMGAVESPKNFSVYQPAAQNVELTWERPNQNVDGYNVYLSQSNYGPFKKINTALLTDTKFTDPDLHEGQVYYMVRAVKEQETFSGTYMNPSQGIMKDAVVTGVQDNSGMKFDIACSPIPAESSLNISLSLPDATKLSIEIYDINGSRINEIISASLAPGSHRFVWNLTNGSGLRINPGIYFVKVITSNSTDVRKVVVLP